MRSWAIATTVLLLVATTGSANAENLLWNNYPDGIDALPLNGTVNMSSERNTQVAISTWAVDDVVVPGGGLAPDTFLSRITWIGALDTGMTYSKADVIFLDDSFNTILEFSDLDYVVTETRDFLDPPAQLYEGEIEFGQSINMSSLDNYFYMGVRLVGDGFFQGRNGIVASSVDSTLYGETEGYVKDFADWRPASDAWYGVPTPGIEFEFAYRLYTEVPEPASLGLIFIGGLLLVRRR